MLTKLKKLFSKEEKRDLKNTNGTGNIENDMNPEVATSQENKDIGTDPKEIKKDLEIDDNGNVKVVEFKEEIETEESIKEKERLKIATIKEEVIKVLKTCYDPEIPVDVWELGLIYDIVPATNGDVLITMTLTSPSCPVAGILPGEIEQKVREHPMVNESKVVLTFDPPWGQSMMSEVAKLELGFL